ncbi:Y-family DNA polymerase [Runella slithyformis]|uniref:DNA-directed DNA polymerase n=1 Tax=Runella slithyformis (strain ATCC 29530 / DSM 19594 / LMG 11500 / NCIMB 11436 / LSU 4) TaxID=761193 RepID=A0A7U4E742_RUNSL|nr:Y-family DNA polymerase [Runella slithyformis]AEI50268.1 DNA-directed DNA polymerase [Runella slithyformis DSM 19594]
MFALVDCNNFYVSCERVFNGKIHHKPVVVLSNNDGCVIARSNEAKALGIKMGALAFENEDFFTKNNVEVFSSNYALYGDMSDRVMKTIAEMVPDMEVYSIDEAFIDFHHMPYEDLEALAQKIRQRVKQYTGIPVSIGIAPTKTLAKVANRYTKKYLPHIGVYQIDSDHDAEKALVNTSVEDIWGVGYKYAKMLNEHNIYNALELTYAKEEWIRQKMHVVGVRMLHELQGTICYNLDNEPSPKKGICVSRSFGQSQKDVKVITEAVATFAARCGEKLRKQQSCAHIVHVFLYTNRHRQDQPQYFNSKVLQLPTSTNSSIEIIRYALRGLELIFKSGYSYKKAGVMISGIVPENQVQIDLFDTRKREIDTKAMKALDELNRRMGRDTVKIAVQGFGRDWHLRQERKSRCYTTRWQEILEVEAWG